MKIHVLLSFVLFVFSVMIINLASQVVYNDWQRKNEAENFVKANQISSLFFKSTTDWAIERAITDMALEAANPATPETHDEILRLRESADSALKAALLRLGNVPEMTNSPQEIAETKDVFQAVEKIRKQADSEMLQPKAARNIDLVSNCFPTLRNLIDKVSVLQLTLETLVHPPSAQNAQLVTLRYLAAEMAEYAGRERTRLAAIIEDKHLLHSEDIAALATDRGHIEQAWMAIDIFRARPDASPQVVAAINNAESAYFHTYDNLRNQIYAAGETGNYPVSSESYFNQATTAIDSILTVASTMDNMAGIEAETTASRCGKQFTFSKYILLLSAVIAGISFWVFLENI